MGFRLGLQVCSICNIIIESNFIRCRVCQGIYHDSTHCRTLHNTMCMSIKSRFDKFHPTQPQGRDKPRFEDLHK